MFKRKFLLFFLFLLISYFISSAGRTPYDYFIRLANAFSVGQIYLTENPPWLNELIPGGSGKYFVAYPPMPAIISMPFVIIFSKDFPQQIVAHFVGASIGMLIYFISLRQKLSEKKSLFIGLTAGIGSIIWFLASQGSSWYLGQLVAAFFLTLAIAEILGGKRSLVVGLALGGAYLSRVHTVLSLPFFFLLIIREKDKVKNKLRKLFNLLLGLSPFLIFNFLYNHARFGVIWDKGYMLIPGVLEEPWYEYGILHVSYIERHIKTAFLALPQFSNEFPFLYPTWNGLAIWFTTPIFVFILFAPIKRLIVRLSYLAIFLISIPIFTHGTTGFAQFGYRFAVDFYPFMFLLLIEYFKDNKIKRIHYFLFLIGLLVNLWGVLFINKLGLTSV